MATLSTPVHPFFQWLISPEVIPQSAGPGNKENEPNEMKRGGHVSERAEEEGPFYLLPGNSRPRLPLLFGPRYRCARTLRWPPTYSTVRNLAVASSSLGCVENSWNFSLARSDVLLLLTHNSSSQGIVHVKVLFERNCDVDFFFENHFSSLTCVRPLVNLEVLAAGKHFPATRERARERLLAGVHADVIHELVLCLERAPVATAALPEARVIGALGPADVLHRDVRDDLVHRAEQLVARLLRVRLIGLDPHARQFLFHRRAHVAEERALTRRRLGGHLVDVVRVVRDRRHRRHRIRNRRVELVRTVKLLARTRVHVHREPHLLVVVHRRLVVRVVVVVRVGRDETREQDVSVVRDGVFRSQRTREHVRMMIVLRLEPSHVAPEQEITGGIAVRGRVMRVRLAERRLVALLERVEHGRGDCCTRRTIRIRCRRAVR